MTFEPLQFLWAGWVRKSSARSQKAIFVPCWSENRRSHQRKSCIFSVVIWCHVADGARPSRSEVCRVASKKACIKKEMTHSKLRVTWQTFADCPLPASAENVTKSLNTFGFSWLFGKRSL